MALLRSVLVLGALMTAPVALAQGKFRMSSEDMGASSRSVVIEMPVNVMAKETVGRVEFNLQGLASLAVEGMMMPQQEEIDDKTKQETGESLVAQGKGAALFVARYTDGANMSGFFWAFGLGYRDETVRWHDKPDSTDKQVNSLLLDDTDMLNHLADLKGPTGHARVGYRFVGKEYPLLIGGYAGARHFQPTVTDMNNTAATGDATVYAPLTDTEKDRLKRVSETSPEVAIELGFMF